MPLYRDAVYGGETVTLENDSMRLEVHKRKTGWGWGELFIGDGDDKRFFAVIEHLGEAFLGGYDHALRLEAEDFEKNEGEGSTDVKFNVRLNLQSSRQKGDSPLAGEVTLSLPVQDGPLSFKLEVAPEWAIHLHYLRGPWLRVGADAFGTGRFDGIFPGIDWVIGDEWSSGTEWFEHPEALRVAPHPHKVAIPIMALSQGNIGVGLSWDPHQSCRSFTTRLRSPQPVYATPNFVDRRSHHLMGLMWPSARWGLEENALQAEPPIKVHGGTKLVLNGEVSSAAGKSLDVIVDYVKRWGMPNPGSPRYALREALDRIARAYNTNLWIEGKGWGIGEQGSPSVPVGLRYYLKTAGKTRTAEELREKVRWADEQRRGDPNPDLSRLSMSYLGPEVSREIAEKLLEMQTEEGAFPFDPEGIHKTSLLDRAALWRPLGHPDETAIDLCARAAGVLILAGEKLQEERYLEGARRALDYCLKFDRPEGGDWWETPLRSPNLLAAGNAAIAYYLGYKQFGAEGYLDKARYWIRSLIPFTHLWEPFDLPMIYNTKPCFNTTSWFLSDWTSKHVQWEVLTVFSRSDSLGIRWEEVDAEVDWGTYQRGVTTAVLRWMIDHDDPEWMSRSEFPEGETGEGGWDAMFSDTFDPVAGTYGGAPIMPHEIAQNILISLRRDR